MGKRKFPPGPVKCEACGEEFMAAANLKFLYCPKCRKNASNRRRYEGIYGDTPGYGKLTGRVSTMAQKTYDGSSQTALARDVIEARRLGLSYGEYRRRCRNG